MTQELAAAHWAVYVADPMPYAGASSVRRTDIYYAIPKSFSAIEVHDLDGVLHQMNEYEGKVGGPVLDLVRL